MDYPLHPHPLPTQKDRAEMPWWAVVGGLVGAVQVYAGLTLVNKVERWAPVFDFSANFRDTTPTIRMADWGI